MCVIMLKNLTNIKSENKSIKNRESRENFSSPVFCCYLNALQFMKNISSIKMWSIKILWNLCQNPISIVMSQIKAQFGEHRRRGGVIAVLLHCTPDTSQSGPSASAVLVNSTASLHGCDDKTCCDITRFILCIERWRPAQFMLTNLNLM